MDVHSAEVIKINDNGDKTISKQLKVKTEADYFAIYSKQKSRLSVDKTKGARAE